MKLRNKKTGEIGQIGYIATSGGEIIVEDISGDEYPYSVISSYKTLAGLNEDWEDYNPAKPLIRDEKIQEFLKMLDGLKCSTKHLEERLKNLNETIAELCGEEEECES